MQYSFFACLVLIAANFFFMGSFSLAKLLVGQVDVTMVMFFRFLAGPLYLIPYFLVKRKAIKMDKPCTLVIRTLCGLCAMFCLFKAFQLGHIGKSMLIFEASVAWTLLFGFFFKNERPHRFSLAVIPLLCLGLWLILKPESSNLFNLIGPSEAYAFLASFFNMGVYVSLKRLRDTNDNTTVVLLTYFFSMLVVAVPASQDIFFLSLESVSILLLMCSVGFLGQLCMSYGFKFNQAGVSSLMMLSGVPFFYLSGFVFFNETISFLGVIGVVCVLLSLSIISKFR